MNTRMVKPISLAIVTASMMLSGLLFSGCTDVGSNRTTSANANAGARNANTAPPPEPMTFEPREPDSYAVTETVTVQPTGNSPQANIPTMQFTFSKNGTDRRVSFNLPDPIGEVIYLEKPQFKYLIFPSRRQYVELNPDELGFPLGNLMSPASVIERLKERTQYERVGTQDVNGRQAVEYRFRGAADTRTQAGTVQADSLVFVDQQTGLPLRSEINTTSTSGAGARIVTDTRDLRLNPDSSQFEVPVGMNKVTSTELKQRVQQFIDSIRVMTEYMRQQQAQAPGAAQR